MAENEKGINIISGLEEELEKLLANSVLQNSMLPALYSDDIYNFWMLFVSLVEMKVCLKKQMHTHIRKGSDECIQN